MLQNVVVLNKQVILSYLAPVGYQKMWVLYVKAHGVSNPFAGMNIKYNFQIKLNHHTYIAYIRRCHHINITLLRQAQRCAKMTFNKVRSAGQPS